MSSHKPPSTRLAMPNPRPLLIGAGLALLGLVMIATRTPQVRDLGWALVVIGTATALWWAFEARRVLAFRKATEKEAARKASLNVTRRQKEEEEKSRRDAEKRLREEQAARVREQRLEEGRRRREVEEAAARDQVEREVRLNAEIARLKALEPAALREEIISRFAARDYQAVPTDEDPNCFLLRHSDGDAVCRIVVEHSGRDTDVRDLEARRRDAGASEAYLVALAGFAPAAVRTAQGKPITLVEAHLLASWESTAAETSLQL